MGTRWQSDAKIKVLESGTLLTFVHVSEGQYLQHLQARPEAAASFPSPHYYRRNRELHVKESDLAGLDVEDPGGHCFDEDEDVVCMDSAITSDDKSPKKNAKITHY